MTLLKLKSVQHPKMDYNNVNGKDINQMFIENETLSISAARKKFQLEPDVEIQFTDEEGTIIEEDCILDYISISTNALAVIIINIKKDESLTTDDGDFSSSTSTLSMNSDTPTVEEIPQWIVVSSPSELGISETIPLSSPPILDAVDIAPNVKMTESTNKTIIFDSDGFAMPSCSTLNENCLESESKVVNAKDLAAYLKKNGGQYIFDEYQKNKIICNRTRRDLVNLAVRMMTDRFGTAIPKTMKVAFAKAIVENFPNLRDPESNKGGYIEQDFNLRFPEAQDFVQQFEIQAKNIISIYESVSCQKLTEIVGTSDSEAGWDIYTRALFAIVHMIPPTAKGKFSTSRPSMEQLFERLIQFCKVAWDLITGYAFRFASYAMVFSAVQLFEVAWILTTGYAFRFAGYAMVFFCRSVVRSSSRRPSNESIKSINLPLERQPLERELRRELTPHPDRCNSSLIDFAEKTTKIRSKSLVNIPRRNRSPSYDHDCLGDIEESPKVTAYRRGSWQQESAERPKLMPCLSVKDAFGAQLDNDENITLPGTPLPSLVQDSTEELITEEISPSTPAAEKTQILDPDSLYFRDGRRKIDMVLVYEEEELGVMTEAEAKRRDNRKVFQENLVKEGLELELEHKDLSFDGKTWFLKIHLPWKTKTRYAALMGMKLPVKRFITISVKAWDDKKDQNKGLSMWQRWQQRWREFFEYNHELVPKEPSFYDATEGRDREEQFVVKDRTTSYSSAQRSLIVMQILLRVKFDDTDKVGIRRLLNNGTFLASFPLHEGKWEVQESDGSILDRRLLYLEWANFGKMMKRQPLNLVRKYFGDKIGLYFCWLGFYTKMLISPAIVGTLCFMYGVLTMDSDDNTATHEICDPKGPGNITLCPLCDRACSYTKLQESCKFAKLTYLFDNPATVFFAIFMSLWATVFLELWRRKQSVIQWEWDLQGTEQDEEPRPEFETSVKTFRTNPVTREKEPYLPTSQKAFRFVVTGSAVFFMLFVVLCAVLGTIIYRLSLVTIIHGNGNYFLKNHAKIVTSVSAAIINLIFIMSLTRGYHRLAIYLTNLESPRTHTEYEDSYTFKIFLFEFMNFYSSLIYIAFFKGRFFDYPGDTISRKSEFFRVKGDICDPAGCLSELCIQLAIIMIGKQILNNFVEIFNPKFYNWWRYRSHRSNTKDLTRKHTRWEEDYHLQDPGRLALFDEYLEMILQYGFVTLFVAAFPLAPLCALLNNIAEIRLDAYKMVTQARRPLAERVEDIGAWYGILRAITYTAVVSNAFVIAYTSDFIPRMVYKYKYSLNEDLVGYIDSSLSVFNTSHYHENMGPDDHTNTPDVCQYRGYRNGPNETDPYGLSPQYWHVFAARLAFVVVFEHVVFALVGIMQYVIPGVPSELNTQIQRELLLAKEAKYEHGLRKTEYDYDDVLNTIRENDTANKINDPKIGIRGSWARRLSRLSDGLDAHVEVVSRKKTSLTSSTVWECS